MPKLPLTSTFAESKNEEASLGRVVNMYAEKDRFSPGKLVFYPTPGARLWQDADDDSSVAGTGIYGTHTYNGSLYVITDNEFVSVTQTGAAFNVSSGSTITGTWTDIKDIDMADNYLGAGSDILMVNGSEAYAWIGTTNYVRIDLIDSGTTTAGAASTSILKDSGASFDTDDDVRVGTKVRNTTTGNEAYITAVAANDLTCDTAIWNTGGGEGYEIGDTDFPKATSVEYFDGYLLANNLGDVQDKGRFYWSSLFEVRDWNSLDFATAERLSDDLLAIRAAGRNLYLFGTKSTEIWYNAGTGTQPFKPKHLMGIGTSHPKSIAKYGDSLILVGKVGHSHGSEITVGAPARGNQVMIVTGANHQVISDRKLEQVLSDHRVVDGATVMYGSVYELNGHQFYRLYISDAITNDNQITSRVFVYDITEGTWHEEQTEYTTGITQRGGPFFKYETLLTTYINDGGSNTQHTSSVLGISEASLDIHEIAPESMGNMNMSTSMGIAQDITRELVSIPISDPDNDNELRHKRVTLEVNTGHRAAGIRGVATATSAGKLICDYMHFSSDSLVDNTMTVYNITDGTSATITTVDNERQLTIGTDIMVAGDEFTIDIGAAPNVTLEWTDDGGITWRGPLTASLGDAGDDPTKIVFNNLGNARKRSYRIKCSDLANFSITDAYVYVDVQRER